tara:strand:+ start:21 stop:359 length:339 start_codon:yes stop_codon:yes gene_type:complete
MKELNTFRQYLTESIVADKDIEKEIKKLEDENPKGFEKEIKKLKVRQAALKLSKSVVKEDYKNDYANSEEDYTDEMVIEKIKDIIKYHELDPSDVMEEIGQEFGVSFEFGRG